MIETYKRDNLGRFLKESGRIYSAEHRINISQALKGKKKSLTAINRIVKSRQNNGEPWHSDAWRKNQSEIMIGRFVGSKNPAYIDGRTKRSPKLRCGTIYKSLKVKVFRRDGGCVLCKARTNLQMDHIKPFSLCSYKEKLDPDNCRTLCKSCHGEYGAMPHCKPIKWATSPINKIVCLDL